MAVAALLIASKYEEIYVPDIQDFVFISDNAYSKKEILKMEFDILKTLEFNVQIVTPYRFLERFTKFANVSPTVKELAQYLIEVSLMEQKMLIYQPSLIASSGLFLAMRVIYRGDGEWTEELAKATKYELSALHPCFKDMCVLFTGIEHCSLQTVRKKFSLGRHLKVAQIKIAFA